MRKLDGAAAGWRSKVFYLSSDQDSAATHRSVAHNRSITNMSKTGPWVYWALLSAIFAALTAVFAKIGLADVNPDLATLIRTTVIMVVLVGFIHFSGQWPYPAAISPKAWLFLVLSGVATGASWICYFRALQIGDASKVAPIDKLSVVLVAVFAVIFLGERPSLRDWTGILLVGAGVLLLAVRR